MVLLSTTKRLINVLFCDDLCDAVMDNWASQTDGLVMMQRVRTKYFLELYR